MKSKYFVVVIVGVVGLLVEMVKPMVSEIKPDVVAQQFEGVDEVDRLFQKASEFLKQGQYSEAISLLERGLVILEKAGASETIKAAAFINEIAVQYYYQGNYTKALPLYQKSLAIYKKALGGDHPTVASIRNNLGGLYKTQGRYIKAEALFQQALETFNNIPGAEHPNVAITLNNLALLYSLQGRYTKAEPLHIQALEIYKRLLGAEHPNVAQSLNNLALVYHYQGRYTEAEPLLIQALEMHKKLLGAEHSDVATGLNNLARLYHDQGRYTEAEGLFQQALEIHKRLVGIEHQSVATSLHNLAGIYHDQGKYTEALDLYQKSLAIIEKVLGAEHPHVASSLNWQSLMYEDQGNITSAIEYRTRGMEVQEIILTTFLSTGSESQKQASMQKLSFATHETISLHLQDAPTNPDAANLSLTTILRRKGRILDSTINSLQTIRDNLTPENQKLLNKLTNTRTQLANLFFRKNRPPLEQYRQQLATLKRKAEKLEADLSLASTAFRKISQPVTLEAVQKLIPTEAALVEIMQYKPTDSKAKSGDKLGQPPPICGLHPSLHRRTPMVRPGRSRTHPQSHHRISQYLIK